MLRIINLLTVLFLSIPAMAIVVNCDPGAAVAPFLGRKGHGPRKLLKLEDEEVISGVDCHRLWKGLPENALLSSIIHIIFQAPCPLQ